MTQSGHTGSQTLYILPLWHGAYAASAFLERFYECFEGIANRRPYSHAHNDDSSLISHFYESFLTKIFFDF
jgi:hypothetical protein